MLKACARILLVLSALPAFQVVAQAEQAYEPISFGDYWNADLAFTYTAWDSLGDLVPAGRGGPFETSGAGWDATIEVSLARVGSSVMFVGFNAGMIGFNSDVFLEDDDASNTSALDLTYAVGTLNFRFGEGRKQYFDIDVGLGVYNAGNLYIDCSAIPDEDCLGSEVNSTPIGGYIGASWAIWRGLKLAGRVHYADFGTIGSIGPESGTLKGPMYTAQIGWEFGDWSR